MSIKLCYDDRYVMEAELTGAETPDDVFLTMREKKPELWLNDYFWLRIQHQVVGFNMIDIAKRDRETPLRQMLSLESTPFEGLQELSFSGTIRTINFMRGRLETPYYTFQAIKEKNIEVTCRDTKEKVVLPNMAEARQWAIERQRKIFQNGGKV